MTPLETRKRLLIAESELNRMQLGLDWCAITVEGRALTDRAKSFGAMVSSAAVLVAGFTAFRRGKAAAKSSWLQNILKGAGLISNLWLGFRAPSRDQKENQEPIRKA